MKGVYCSRFAFREKLTTTRFAQRDYTFKPRSDITVQGHVYPPEGEAESRFWEFGLRVGELRHILRVNGRRHWERAKAERDAGDAAGGWRPGPSEPIASVAVDYRNAAGGRILGHPDGERHRFNPIGCGVIHPDYISSAEKVPAPVIDSARAPVTGNPFADIEPQGMAPIPPFWRFRQQYAGTYDERWKEERHPQLPEDFDYRFYQSAHPALIYPGYLRGDEIVEAVYFIRGGGRVIFNLPGVQPYAQFHWTDEREVTARLNLDGLHIDLREGPPWRVDLTWRAWIVICPRFFKIDLFHTKLGDPALRDMPRSGIEGLVEADDAVVSP